jgi:peptidoglycan/LPS O-acetylase OafA/YrhL
MGAVRTFLAIAVVLGHSTAWGGGAGHFLGLRPLPPYFAVQSFFLISGFYMELIRSKYQSVPVLTFYTNRYTRLLVSYWIVAAVSVALALSQPDNLYLVFLRHPGEGTARLFLAFTNIFIIGQDTVQLFRNNATESLIVPQAWSLGAELWFYMLVPIFWRMPTKILIAIAGLSALMRIVLVLSPLPFFPWQQRFFPAELMFFVLGMLACRCSRNLHLGRLTSAISLVGLLLFVGCVGWLQPDHRALNSFCLAAVLFFLVPGAFQLSRNWKADRLIGEFSYPIYLWHIGLQYFVEPANRLWGGGLLLLLSILASVPLVFWVEMPMERWRSSRLGKASQVLAVARSS